MKKELPKIYIPQDFEDEIYKKWEKSGVFNPDNITTTKKTYCNILPPPNANGELHVGHASGYTVMDIFGRYNRMNGRKTLLLPGKDHAGIQTQVVFEKKLKQEENIDRYKIGREKFYQKTYDFCIDRANYMRNQEKKIGISADWSREKFTLDPDVLKIALETFIQMEKDGLIYKGKRIINWCPRCATALSDVEVLHKESAGKLYYIKYPLENSTEFITIATTRPETMLGDSAIAINPKDTRYTKFIGKKIILPLQDRIIPIISDKRIDSEFGTGVVKITPSHDPLDWQIGKDHNLEEIQVINEEAKITELGGKYQNLTVLSAREQILKDLKKINLLEKIEEINHNISICERCKTTIEPLTSKQWFIKVEKLKNKAIESIKNGEIEIFPANFKNILIDWFENLHDWCISRQIWWGPQFPIWYCSECGEEKYIVSLKKPASCPHCNSKNITQDENTFDTWFTSGQWAYTTLKSKPNDSEIFYPSDMMVMGRDLLFFWASRMIMLSLYATDKIPFKNLFFTGLVRDKEGHKFSKSRGNGIDPLVAINKFGADALRMSLIMDSSPGQDSRLYEEKIETFRNFANKLWNISRFCLTQENFKILEKIEQSDIKNAIDAWIIYKLNKTLLEINRLFENKQIAVAADILKSFTWNEFADKYIESNKNNADKKILGYVFHKLIKLWHPFMPFITEHIWSLTNQEKMLISSSWPKIEINNIEIFQDKYNIIEKYSNEIIKTIRNARAEKNIPPQTIIDKVIIICPIATGDALTETLKEVGITIQKLAKIKEVVILSDNKYYEIFDDGLVQRFVLDVKLQISLSGLIDTKKEKVKIEKEITNIEGFVKNQKARLADKNFTSKAPQNIIDQQKETLQKKETELGELKKHLQSIK